MLWLIEQIDTFLDYCVQITEERIKETSNHTSYYYLHKERQELLLSVIIPAYCPKYHIWIAKHDNQANVLLSNYSSK